MSIQILIGDQGTSSPSFTEEQNLFGQQLVCALSGVAVGILYRGLFVGRDGVGCGALYDGSENLLAGTTGTVAITAGNDSTLVFASPVSVVQGVTYRPTVAADATSDNKNPYTQGFFGNGDGNTMAQLSHVPGASFPDPYTGTLRGGAYFFGGYVFGYVKPIITAFNGGAAVSHGETGVLVDGSSFVDFDYSGTNPTLYLCPTSTFNEGTSVVQTLTGIGDTQLEATIDATGLSGTVYAFVKTGFGQVNTTGIAVEISGGASEATHEGESVVDDSDTLLAGVIEHSGESVIDDSDTLLAGVTEHSGESVVDDSDTLLAGVAEHSGESVQDDSDAVVFGVIVHSGESVQDDSDAMVSGVVSHSGESETDTEQTELNGVVNHSGESIPDEGDAIITGAVIHSGQSVQDESEASVYGVAVHYGESVADDSSAIMYSMISHVGESIQDESSSDIAGVTEHAGESVTDIGSASLFNIIIDKKPEKVFYFGGDTTVFYFGDEVTVFYFE